MRASRPAHDDGATAVAGARATRRAGSARASHGGVAGGGARARRASRRRSSRTGRRRRRRCRRRALAGEGHRRPSACRTTCDALGYVARYRARARGSGRNEPVCTRVLGCGKAFRRRSGERWQVLVHRAREGVGAGRHVRSRGRRDAWGVCAGAARRHGGRRRGETTFRGCGTHRPGSAGRSRRPQADVWCFLERERPVW